LQVRALDRETNTAFVLLAAPSHTGKLHSAASRAVRRDSSLKSTDMKNIRSAFAEISSRQHATRTASLLEQLSQARLSSRDGSSSSSREKDLRRALDTAIGSLHALGTLYSRREMRWAEEKLKLDEDKEKVELVLKQVLGASIFGTVGDAVTPA
jgi:glucose-6-phosphate dehydrogenase assembly protein OpcA